MARSCRSSGLNEYKISGPTVWGRESDERIASFLADHGYESEFVEGSDPMWNKNQVSRTSESA
jgi:xylulose-5-phosphate/fructose-6-phosphate phosphoketolase